MAKGLTVINDHRFVLRTHRHTHTHTTVLQLNGFWY